MFHYQYTNPDSHHRHDGQHSRYDIAAVEVSSTSSTGTMMPMGHCPTTAYAIVTSVGLDDTATKAHGSASVGGRNDVGTGNDIGSTDAMITASRNYDHINTFGRALPIPRIRNVEDAAQAVLSLRKSDGNDDDREAYTPGCSRSPSPFSSNTFSDNSSCPDQEDESMGAEYNMYDNEFDIDAENSEFDNMLTTDEDNDVASRLKRIAVCCRKYNIRPKNFARVQNEGDCMILLPKTAPPGTSYEGAKKATKMREQPERIAKQASSINTCTATTNASVVGAAAARDGAVADTVVGTALRKATGGRKTAKSTRSTTKTTRSTSTAKGKKKASKTRASVAKKNKSRPLKPCGTKLRRNKNARSLPVYSRPATEFGKGWIAEGYERQTGAYKGHIDKYWISPSNRKFRSIVGVRRFIDALKKYNGDEEKAYAMK